MDHEQHPARQPFQTSANTFRICTKGYRGAEKVVCDICGKAVTARRLQGHKNMHTLSKTIKCEVKGCEKKFRTEEELRR